MTFLEELNGDNFSGVAYKNIQLKKNIISFFCTHSSATIADLCKELNLSVPKVTNLINELIQEELVQDLGKINTNGGRRPNLYGLIADSVFFLGVDVKQNHINIGITNLQNELVYIKEHLPFTLSNSTASLEELIQLIHSSLKTFNIPKEKILGMGINLSGRINYATGYSYSFFHFHEEPLAKILENELGIKTFLENDSRAMAYGEFNSEAIKTEKNVIFLNLDYGLGMGVMINSSLYYGKSGFAGEFGHIPIFNNEIICNCGKKGCLETEASGWALTRLFQEKLQEGSSSIILSHPVKTSPKTIADIKLKDIIAAAKADDVLAIELIAEVGEKIGRAIALLINVFNPELVILGGILSETGEYITLPIKSAINKFSLSLVNNDTKIISAVLGEKAGVLGACFLVRNRLLNKDYQ
ncbi:ROK family protein [Sphingobacterium spiritivorum]|uniref:ROK family protein n=1 Tax=Sphingobacterium spiritivorum ATCC 33861 TaxID=525373 RepID=D7VP07_SPHSI|nr:ROK family protein [Sphingobacterium spiritivorum]EFK57654.1 ROK family protein [Sphingobacterium spiritivorum ATCC 33861]QQT36303.1 ROK family protein [Sphingobacterium spiritivorum]WQD33043.1 ROK family protein [Sphingobacterium spiritivorum]SUJ18573.1 Glucokinase [Sphingobacterium spiritivorum]